MQNSYVLKTEMDKTYNRNIWNDKLASFPHIDYKLHIVIKIISYHLY